MTTTSQEEVSAALLSHFTKFVREQRNPEFYLKYTTQQMSQPMCDYIKKYSGPQEVMQQCCGNMIERIVDLHSFYCRAYGGNCQYPINHMTLYLAARMAYHSTLPNTDLVVRLLDQIFQCEGTLRNLIMGAYHQPEICYTVAQVQSLYSSLEEGMGTFRYFLHHTNLARKLFKKDGVEKRMVDLSIQEECLGHPAVYAIGANCPWTFKLLVEHGTNLYDDTERPSAHALLELIRTQAPKQDTPEVKACRKIFRREHPEVLEQKDQTLMMLCRKVIRRELNRSFQLPAGIEGLPLPSKIKEYLHLRCD